MYSNVRYVVVVILLVASAGACERKPAYSGIGNWMLGESRLADSPGLCRPEGPLTFCQASPIQRSMQVALGGQNAEAGLLYRGTTPASKLIEIILTLESCRANDLRPWLIENFGKPNETTDNRMYWSKKGSFMSAYAPDAQGGCRVNFVVDSDKQRIADLRAGK